METVRDFIFFFFYLGSKITADGDCSHEIKRCLLFGRKVMTNLDKKASLPESSKSGFCSLSDLGKVVQFPGASVFLLRVMIITWRQLLNLL